MMRIRNLYILPLLALMWACGGKLPSEHEPVARLDLAVERMAVADSAVRCEIFDSLRLEFDAMLSVVAPDMPKDESVLMEWHSRSGVAMFQNAVDSVFPNLDTFEATLGGVMAECRADSLGLPPMRFAAVVWGSRRRVVRVGDVMLVALNHYLGHDFPGYASWPAYSVAEKTPAMMPYDVAAALAATQHPFEVEGMPTMLNWMLYEGALVRARMALVDDAKLDMALGFTPEQLSWAEDHLDEVWAQMSIMKLVYTTDPLDIDKVIAPSAGVDLGGLYAPGRIGRYVGYRIVEAYVKRHPGVSLSFLLSPEFYAGDSTLVDSGF